jgi:hypothetical protein
MFASPVMRLRSTIASVLWRTWRGAVDADKHFHRAAAARRKVNPVTDPTRMPRMRTSLRTSRPSSDWLTK